MKVIQSGHGSGGKLMNELVEGVIKKVLGRDSIQLDDSALLDVPAGKIAFTTDTFTVTPLFFPGGTIGTLAVNGTVNDLSMMGARPRYLSCGLVLEEGLALADLEEILKSMKEAADYAGVSIVTGDTKVVPRGAADRIFINTSGIGIIEGSVPRVDMRPGDKIIINGFIGDHGIAVMAERNGLTFQKGLLSDCAPLNHLVHIIMEKFPGSVRFMRDPTRGGVASVLNEIVRGRNWGAKIIEDRLPVRDEVRGVCDILGIDPLYAANEGKVLLVVEPESADEICLLMRSVREGAASALIGEIETAHPGKAYIETAVGGSRILPLLIEEQLPRIC